jgi:membrane protein implicated in regulation of membrane protease activity
MTSWWEVLTIELQIFYGIGILSLGFLVIQLFMTLLGLAGDMDGVPDGDADHSSGLSLISIRTITAFFVGFGWTGVIAIKAGLPFVLAMGISLVIGLVFMFGIYFLMLMMLRMQDSGTLDFQNAIGEVGTVYVTIPAQRSGCGQVEVMIQGRLHVAEALSSTTEVLSPQQKIKVVGLVGRSTLLVEPLV